MKDSFKHIIICITLCLGFYSWSQTNNTAKKQDTFIVRGSVIENDTNKPIPKVNVEVNGGAYTTTNSEGEFRIQVKLNDELVIRNSDFETVYIIIKSNERITVKVQPNTSNLSTKYKRIDANLFNALIDSAEYYKKKNTDKSIEFITDAKAIANSSKNNAMVYEVLADVFFE